MRFRESDTAQRQIVLFFAFVLFPIFVFIVSLVIYDPLQLFYARFEGKKWHRNMRLQIAGIVHNYSDDFDSIIFGSSMLQNTSADDASAKLDGKFINISASASDFYERYLILSWLLEKKKVKKVIYSLDSVYTLQPKGYTFYPLRDWAFLYDHNRLNDIQVYFNQKMIQCLAAWSNSAECTGDRKSLTYPNAWYDDGVYKPRFGGVENWLRHGSISDGSVKAIIDTAQHVRAKEIKAAQAGEASKAVAYVNDYVLALVALYPETEFTIIFPPYSRLYFAIWHQYDIASAKMHEAVVRSVVESSQAYPNLRVYGYEDDVWIDDIANYKDVGHYHISFNDLMTVHLKQREHELDFSTLDTYLGKARANAENYDILALEKKIMQIESLQ